MHLSTLQRLFSGETSRLALDPADGDEPFGPLGPQGVGR